MFVKKGGKMFLQEGDKVSFLNEKRTGIIRGFINARLASVEIEEGFEIPVPVNELVKILPVKPSADDAPKASQSTIPQNENTPPAYIETAHEPDKEDTEENIIFPISIPDKKKEGVYLYLEPKDKEDIPGKEICIGLINHTATDLLYAVYCKYDDTWHALTYDACPPYSRMFLKEVSIAVLVQWECIKIQAIYYAETGLIKPPLDNELTLKAGRYFREGAFAYSSLTESRSILLSFFEEVQPEIWPEEQWIAEKINPIPVRNIKEMTHGESAVDTLPKKHIVAPFIAEVDLHIEQLTDDSVKMGNHDKLNLQLDYFAKCLDAAIVHKFKKITFIHGVGQGRLKEEIHKAINESYPGVKIQDAPFKKFGMGATEVLIPFNLTR